MRPVHRKAAGGLAAAIALAAPLVMLVEGKRNTTYADPIGLPTDCWGHLDRGSPLGTRHSDDECKALLSGDLNKAAIGVRNCTPGIENRLPVWAAATSFAFNVGTARYCGSSVAERFRKGDYHGGCNRLGAYVYAGGKRLRGLVIRRQKEVALCLHGAA